MKLIFGEFELDPATAELRRNGTRVPLEKQAFDLLMLLADNAERVVSKDEIVEKIWDGRFISDGSISTAVKQVRRAVGDDGAAQSVIKTLHGRGFRFVAALKRPAVVQSRERAEAEKVDDAPSIAVLPFAVFGEGAAGPAIGDAVPAELINALSRLRWLFVTARGSSFRFRDPATPPETLKEALGVRYALTGTVEALGDMLAISTELARTDNGAVIWSNRYATALAEIHEVRAGIVRDVVGAMEIHIPYTEAAIARSLAPDQIGAWSHFHIGLQHIYRFNRADNLRAAAHFRQALELEPDFARAHAGLSFTHWQTAFMHFGEDRSALLGMAEESARRANDIDPHDPFANYNLARVHWLRGDIEGFGALLDRALTINPNFAQGTYSRSLANMLAGNGEIAREQSDRAMSLSPLDPLKYAMMSSHGMSLIGDGRFGEAAEWIEKACHLPGAHFYIDMIAAAAQDLSGNEALARMRAERARARQPGATAEMFFGSFPIREGQQARKAFGEAFGRLGF